MAHVYVPYTRDRPKVKPEQISSRKWSSIRKSLWINRNSTWRVFIDKLAAVIGSPVINTYTKLFGWDLPRTNTRRSD